MSSTLGTSSAAVASALAPGPSPGIGLRGGTGAGEELVEPVQHVLAEVDAQGVERSVELVHRPRADDRCGDSVLVQQPGQSHVGRVLAELVAEILPLPQRRAVLLES